MYWKQHPRKWQQCGHLPPISKTIQVRRTRHAEHCWWSKDKLISDILQWTFTHRHTSVDQPVRTYIISVRTLDVVWRTCRERGMIGMDGEQESKYVSINSISINFTLFYLGNVESLAEFELGSPRSFFHDDNHYTHTSCLNVIYLRGSAEWFIGWKVNWLKRSIFCWWYFWPIWSEYCYTYEINVVNSKEGFVKKKKLHLVTFNESILVSLWTFQTTIVYFREFL